MALYKNVNGVNVLCSVEEESAIAAEWAANDPANKTPEQLEAESMVAMVSKFSGDKLAKILFEVLLDQENRLRTLAGQPTITRNQYRNGLLTVWRNL